MSGQPTWSQHEAALLLEGYLRSLEGSEKRATIITRISEQLRRMAINNGIEIDDIYRNINGISFQMQSMESAYLGYTKGKAATKLFAEMVDIWKNNPDRFQELLSEAHTMAASKHDERIAKEAEIVENNAQSIEEAFFAFARSKRSAFSQPRVMLLMKNAEEFSRAKILGEINLKKLSDARRKIGSGTLIKIRYGSDAQAIRDVVALYCAFLKNYQPPLPKPENSVAMTPVKETVVLHAEPVRENNENVLESSVQQVSFLSEDDSALHVDFESKQDLSFTRPHAYVYRGTRHNATSWGKMFLEICALLFNDRHDDFTRIMNGDVPGAKTLTYADENHKDAMRSPRAFLPGYYAETNICATDIARRISGLYHYFNLNGQLDITYYKSAGSTSPSTEAPTSRKPNSEKPVLHIDFNQKQDLAFTKPDSYTYCGKEYEATSWGKMFLEICGLLLKDKPDSFMRIMNGDVPGASTLTYADVSHKDAMRSPREFAPGFYAETNIGATDIVRRISGLYRYFDLAGQLDIAYYRTDADESKPKSKEWIIDKLIQLGITYEDKRDRNGCLWILGGDELMPFVEEAKIHGYRLVRKQDYGNTFSNQSRWYTMDRPIETVTIPAAQDVTEYLNRFEKWLLTDRNYADRTAYSYRSAIKVSYDYIVENHLDLDLFAGNAEAVQKAARVLMARSDFAERNHQQNNRYHAALQQLELFFSERPSRIEMPPKHPEKDPNIDRYHRLLSEYFSDGIRLRANIPLRKLRRFWSEIYGEELTADEDQVWNTVESICITHEGYAYLPETLADEERAKLIQEYIDARFSSGIKLVYYDAVYRDLQASLDGSRIYSEDTLQTYMRFMFPQYAHTNRYMAVSNSVKPKLEEEIEEVIRRHVVPMKAADVYEALSYAPKKEIDAAWYRVPGICWNTTAEYFHADAIDLTEDELHRIAELIQSGIDENGYVAASELYNTIRSAWPEMVERYSAFSYIGYREALKRKLGYRFDFNAEVISAYGRKMTIADVFSEYGRRHEHFTSSDVAMLSETLNNCFYLESLLTYSLRLNPDEYISQKLVNFDVDKTDETLDICVKGDYLPFSEMAGYSVLPDFGYSWNEYVLEQYLDKYSRRFRLLHGGYNQKHVSAAIVRKDAPFETYMDLMADAVALSGCELNEAAVLNWLISKRYIARRRFSDIGKLLTQARLIRERKGV